MYGLYNNFNWRFGKSKTSLSSCKTDDVPNHNAGVPVGTWIIIKQQFRPTKGVTAESGGCWILVDKKKGLTYLGTRI